MSNILFCGDPHGSFKPIHYAATGSDAQAIVLLGDMDLERPIDVEFAEELDRGVRVLYIPGNHDYDRDLWFNNLFDSERCENLHARVIEVCGIRLAGLGGNFQSTIWHPHDGPGEPKYETRESFMRTLKPQARWKKGLPRKRRGAIWLEDIEALAEMEADVLVTHEAPSCHMHGHTVFDDLARDLAAGTIVHGHHHYTYEDAVGGIRVIGLDRDNSWVFDWGCQIAPVRYARKNRGVFCLLVGNAEAQDYSSNVWLNEPCIEHTLVSGYYDFSLSLYI
ncbi:metallophosphoesterase [Magnetovibrio sp. PR-2]|uniref:metallophosphoesterase family protein n=1 Tax=Magnetovibrio sp. PR-2 TaxID=3120356 RepID=UPI002FCE5DC1